MDSAESLRSVAVAVGAAQTPAYPFARNPAAETGSPPGGGDLRLIHTPSGYLINDLPEHRLVPIRWPGYHRGERIHVDSIDDGSWALCAERRPAAEGAGYFVYWAYPFSSRIHQWTLDDRGNRIGSRDLPGPEAVVFLTQRQHEHIQYVVRLLAMANLSEENQLALASLAPRLERAIPDSVELALLCLGRPDIFSGSTVSTARQTIETFLDECSCACPINPASLRSRIAPLARFIDRQAAPASRAERRARLDLLLALGEHINYSQPYAPLHADVRFPRTPSEEQILREAGVQCFLFEVELREDAALQLIIPRDYNLYHRIIFTISYLNYLISEFITREPCLSDNKERFSWRDGAAISCVVYTHDLPPDTTVAALGFERRRGSSEITLLPDLYYYNSFGYRQLKHQIRHSGLEWEQREAKLVWRGSTTGLPVLNMQNINLLPRLQLCRKALQFPAIIDAGFVSMVQAPSENEQAIIENLLKQSGLWKDYIAMEDMARYRFLLEIDGNANPWGFIAKLLCGSCVLKVESEWEGWFYGDISAWEHFVPLAGDLSDFEQKVDWCLSHDSECREIASRGQQFAFGLRFGSEMARTARAILSESRFFIG